MDLFYAHREWNIKITEVISKRKVPQSKLWNFSNLDDLMVTPRGPSAKHFWGGLERFGGRLEELGISDDEVKNI